MAGDEYIANEPAIMAQLQAIGIPTDNELETRSDGTEVRGYYRSV